MGRVADDTNAARELIAAVEAALDGDWEAAHRTAQRHEGRPLADWLHATLHKIEGDAANARYWYARTHLGYERYPEPRAELAAILHELKKEA